MSDEVYPWWSTKHGHTVQSLITPLVSYMNTRKVVPRIIFISMIKVLLTQPNFPNYNPASSKIMKLWLFLFKEDPF